LIDFDASTAVVPTNKAYIQNVFEKNVRNIGLYFPFIRYSGDFYQEKVSANLLTANTVLVLEKCIDASTKEVSYEHPYIE